MSNALTLERLLQRFACRPATSSADAALQPLMQQLVSDGYTDLPLPGKAEPWIAGAPWPPSRPAIWHWPNCSKVIPMRWQS